MNVEQYVTTRLRCLEIANERAFDPTQVLPLAAEYENFCLTGALKTNVVDINKSAQ